MTDQTPHHRNERAELAREALKSPRAAGIAGILFAILLTAAIVLIRVAIPDAIGKAGSTNWLQGDTSTVTLAFTLVPFAGIAFLWFIGVVRDQLGALEDRLFATVFLGSGLLFLAMLFAAAAVVGGILAAYAAAPDVMDTSGVAIFTSATIYTIIRVYAIRMAGVFMISFGTITLRTQIMSRPFVILTYLLALVMLLSVNGSPWLSLIFPGWVFVISLFILISNMRREASKPEASIGAPET